MASFGLIDKVKAIWTVTASSHGCWDYVSKVYKVGELQNYKKTAKYTCDACT